MCKATNYQAHNHPCLSVTGECGVEGVLPGSVYVAPMLAEDMAHCLQHEQAAQVGVELPGTLAALL